MIEVFYKKKLIRDILSLYDKTKWQALLSSLIEYGILNLIKNNINYKTLSSEDIIDLVESIKKKMNLDDRKIQKTQKINNPKRNTSNSSFTSNYSISSKKSKQGYDLNQIGMYLIYSLN